ncbi:MAG: hypothetical protein HFI89_08755 [Lachnospiraceae bacterium]|nr:hypothetical protein [Lachnospiraceae bacterium]
MIKNKTALEAAFEKGRGLDMPGPMGTFRRDSRRGRSTGSEADSKAPAQSSGGYCPHYL